MSLAQRVRDFRYSKGWGPDELASRAEISRTALYQIESGKTELPRAGTLRRIAIALDVPMESLLGHPEAGGTPGQEPFSPTPPPRGTRGPSEWFPADGGPLATPASHRCRNPAIGDGDDARFAVEAQEIPSPSPIADPRSSRELELARKLHELLDSPLGEGVATILEESYRMLPLLHLKG